nr:MAG TPA: hypothetical protein [Caudoviricetes sp.]
MLHKSCWELHSRERLCVNNVKRLAGRSYDVW